MLGDMALIRGTALLGYPELVEELGADPLPLLGAAGIPPASVGNAEAYVSYLSVIAAVESAARETGTLDFGLRLASRQGIDILGPVGVAARTAPTVGAALESISRYLPVYSPAVAATLTATDDARFARVEFRVDLPNLPDSRQNMELSLGVTLRVIQTLAGPDFAPVTVHLPHDPLSPPAHYRRYFGCRASFAQPFAGFLLRSAALNRPVHPSANTAVHETLRAYLETVAPQGATSTTGMVRLLVRQLLPTGALELAVVAQHMSMHPRTLQRRLARDSTSFDQIVEQIRRERALYLLRDTEMPMAQLASALGYSEQSVLTRACQRWFGRTPSQQRRNP